MRIAIYSSSFAPAIGGLEVMAKLLAEEFSAAGHAVTVVTRTTTTAAEAFPFRIVRAPSQSQWMQIVRKSDVTLHMSVSLKAIWANLLLCRPCVVSHQTWYTSGKKVRDQAKGWATRLVTNIAASKAIADRLPARAEVIPNCYDDQVFNMLNGKKRCGLAFVGRLVSDKGADLLLKAVSQLRQEGFFTSISIVGDGPERGNLEALTKALKLNDSVVFLGAQEASGIARVLNEHEVVVVPSVWEEPFGIVALEGIACGCVVIGSSNGGLPESIGDCGITFPNGDIEGLAGQLKRALSDELLRRSLRAGARRHLEAHSKRTVSRQYLQVLSLAASNKTT